MLNIENALEQKFPNFEHSIPWIKKPTLGFLKKISHEKEINQFLETHQDLEGFDFVDQVLDYFNFSYSISHRDKKNIPATGRVVIVANHPLGALDGLSLLKLVGEVRRDVKIVVNDILMSFKAVDSLLLPVDNLTQSTKKSSVSDIIDCLNNEEAVIVFPAGEVSRIRPNGVRDGKWTSGFLTFAKKSNSPILPVYVDARNSSLFYSSSMVYKPLAGMLLAHEVFNKHSKTISMKVGQAIPYAQLSQLPLNKKALAKLIRKHLYRISKGQSSLFKTEQTIIHPEERRAIKKELQHAELLGETKDGMKIYLFDYKSDSAVMNEIGRLREFTFRQVGEGTGKKCDLDRYDRDYRHLVLWDEKELEIAGSYRLAEVDNLLKKENSRGIYSQELFDYDADIMAPYFVQGIELGRSFVSPKYWGKRSLDYLWYGIGAYLKRYPNIRYLFGPVSLSNSYPEFAKALIVTFYQHYYQAEHLLAEARVPFRISGEMQKSINTIFTGLDYGTDLKTLRLQLAHMNVSVPTLYKQYSDLCEQGGVTFIDFNVDTNFSDCIDGLVMVDLDLLKVAKRKRYLGN
ncbi:lysophospholipid acyltransferase family protein [Pseudomonadota bacterium]|nr:lysophospholipid acyltransferase family protein [Pseudomonadota bacterium]